jgi:uncharacterized membrane protein
MALFETQPGDVAHIIQLAVAPVFLLSGVGVTLGLFTNRIARIVDRARALENLVVHNPQEAEDLRVNLQVLAKRARYINTAITLGTISGLLVTLTVVMLFANAFMTMKLAGAIAVFFVAAMLTLTAALLVFLIEVRLSTATLRFGKRI